MGYYARGEVWIPLQEWTNFVAQYLPRAGANISFGPPEIRGDDVVVPYAANTECSPAEEIDPPDWLRKGGE